MDERKRRILQAIVQDYIATAEPVGSRTIARRYLSQISAATIRNEMADLEEMGLLEQPHTSAGRIPSEKGYRYYVDHLLEDPVMAKSELNILRSQFASGFQAIEDIVQQTSHLLSSLTSYVALVSGPSSQQSAFHRIQLVEVGGGQAVAVLVTDSGHVANRMIQVPKGVDQSWLNSVSEYLSSTLRGRPMQQLVQDGLTEIKRDIAGRYQDFDQVFMLMMELLRGASFDKLYLGSTTQILRLPEFQDLARTRNLLALVEEDELLQQLLSYSDESNNKIHIRIGSENSMQEVGDLSLVTASYQLHGKPMGYLGILGPIRMDYGRVVAVVREVSDLLSQTLADLEKG